MQLAGAKARAVLLPSKTLATHSLGNATGLLLVGRTRVVWCSSGTLKLVTELAITYGATHALNWEGASEVNLEESMNTPTPGLGAE